MSRERLRFSPSILRLLGEELSPLPDQGILELIKNAYDADATECMVELCGAHIKGGSIKVRDNGQGMTLEEIRDGWLVVGDSLKSQLIRSEKGRLLVGDKGLGRLAALRLGKKVILLTRPHSSPTKQFRVEIDWNEFDTSKVVEDVELEISEERRPIGFTNGTDIEILALPFAWQEKDVNRLARAILLLTDPFHDETGFRAELKVSEFNRIAELAKEGYFSVCDYHLSASVDENGFAKAEVRNTLGELVFEGNHKKIADDPKRKHYKIPKVTFELWEFLLDARRFSTKSVSLTSVKQWLTVFGGVRLYHRGMRVLPYGEQKNDWLDMNLRRVRSPEMRPSTNNSLGLVKVEDPYRVFNPKTDRLGFVEDEVFEELRRFAGDVLDWMATERLRARDKRRKSQRERVKKQKEKAKDLLSDTLSQLPVQYKKKVEPALKKLLSAHAAEITLLADTAQLYYTLGTVGTTAAAFAHQTKHPLEFIVQDATALENWLGDPDSFGYELFKGKSSKAVKRIKEEADALYAFAAITLHLLEHEKRRAHQYQIHHLIESAVNLLNPYIELREVKIEYDFVQGDPKVLCSKAAMESIITNFLTNSMRAFTMDYESEDEQIKNISHVNEERIIKLSTRIIGDKIAISLLDNGPGISHLSLDDIWLPGKTTTTRGTGLGLTIVRDIVNDLGGAVEATEHSELGGAKFTIILPLKK